MGRNSYGWAAPSNQGIRPQQPAQALRQPQPGYSLGQNQQQPQQGMQLGTTLGQNLGPNQHLFNQGMNTDMGMQDRSQGAPRARMQRARNARYDGWNPQMRYGGGGGGGDDDEPSEGHTQPGEPGYIPPPVDNRPNNPGGIGGFLDAWGGVNLKGVPSLQDPNWYRDAGNVDAMENYLKYAVPYFNANLGLQTQNYNETADTRNFGEQQRVNTSQMGLAERGAGREDLALKYGQANNARDYTEMVRQANLGNTLARDQLAQLSSYQGGQNANQRYATDVQQRLGLGQNANAAQRNTQDYLLGQGQNANAAQQNANTLALGQGANANQRYGTDIGYKTAQMQNATQAQQNAWNRELGLGQNANQAMQNKNTLQLGLGANANQAAANQNTLTLGQGQLGFQNRQLDVGTGQQVLDRAQQAALAREGYKNQLQQSQMQAYGRIGAPSARAMTSWY